MSSYDFMLPDPFPHMVEMHIEDVEMVVLEFNRAVPPYTNGSSYAITSDAREDWRKVWMSHASFERFKKMNLIGY